MSEDNIVLVQKLQGISDHVRRFLNQYKTQLLMKGYKLKTEGDIVLKKGFLFETKTNIGGWIKVEIPKTLLPKRTLIKVQCQSEGNDLIFTASSARQNVEIPPEFLIELESLIEKTLQKITA